MGNLPRKTDRLSPYMTSSSLSWHLQQIEINTVCLPNVTILQERKKVGRISEQEILLLLRAYQEHPSSWAEIIATVKTNAHSLPEDCRRLYATTKTRQLKERLCTKLGKTMISPVQNIKNGEIRYVTCNVSCCNFTRHNEQIKR